MFLENQNLGLVPLNFVIERETSTIKRIVQITPTLNCGDFVNLYNPGTLSTRIISQKEGVREITVYMNTDNFKSQVPTNVLCNLSVVLEDNFGSEPILLNAQITFTQPQEVEIEVETTQDENNHWSLRGNSIDIYGYKQSVLSTMKQGYNYFDVELYNHKTQEEEITVVVSSLELKMSKTKKVIVLPNEKRSIELPIYITQEIEAGTYPLRISINQNGEKQARYTYINIE